MNNIDFCNETSEIANSIVDLCATSITSLDKQDVREMYRIWNQRFLDYPWERDFDKDSSIISKEFDCPENASHLGIDFPTWLNFKESKEQRKRIMIVGIDPLRSDENPGQVSIGTPYAFHRSEVRNGHTKEYWKFIHQLAQDYSVYITDIFKVFFYGSADKTNRSYKDQGFVKKSIHQQILAKEIALVKPDIIITMGNLATRFVLNDTFQSFAPISKYNISQKTLQHKSGVDLIPMVHLSGSSRGGQKVFLETNNQQLVTGKTNGNLYFDIIKAYLEKRQPTLAKEIPSGANNNG